MLTFIWGATTLGCWAIGLFFLRFWKTSRDRLFAFFAVAFWVLSLNWLGLSVMNPEDEARHFVYMTRVVAFLIIIFGIVDKNRSAPRGD